MRWIDRYVRAWGSNDPAAIWDLFTPDAPYRPRLSDEPWRGREEIVTGWIAYDDQPGTWTFRAEVLATAGDLAFGRGWTHCSDTPTDYDNLWGIRFDDNQRCREFTEWFMERN